VNSDNIERIDKKLTDSITLECLDTYEAEKLEGMLSHTSDELTYVLGIVKTVESEVVIMLRDKSCHSVIMRDIGSANTLNGFVRDLTFKKKSIKSISRDDHKLHVCYVDNLLEI